LITLKNFGLFANIVHAAYIIETVGTKVDKKWLSTHQDEFNVDVVKPNVTYYWKILKRALPRLLPADVVIKSCRVNKYSTTMELTLPVNSSSPLFPQLTRYSSRMRIVDLVLGIPIGSKLYSGAHRVAVTEADKNMFNIKARFSELVTRSVRATVSGTTLTVVVTNLTVSGVTPIFLLVPEYSAMTSLQTQPQYVVDYITDVVREATAFFDECKKLETAIEVYLPTLFIDPIPTVLTAATGAVKIEDFMKEVF